MPLPTSYNPDVLSCLANLSSDEVFTPPQVANQMLDLLPPKLWSDPNATFLDPCCKSGVFLREIAKRLDKGLESHIPDRQQRINHIMTRQLFGIAITELTGLIARRSLYCSKTANGKYSVCTAFEKPNVPAHRTHLAGRPLRLLRRQPSQLRPRSGTGNPRLQVHSHRTTGGSFDVVIRRKYIS